MKFGNQLNRAYLFALCSLGILSLVGKDFMRSDDGFRQGQLRYLTLALAAIGTRALWRMNPAWALFWGLSAAGWILRDWPTHGMFDVLLIGGCLVIGNEIRERFNAEDVLSVVAVLACVQAVYGLSQWFGYDPFFRPDDPFFIGRAIGTIGHFTMLGTFVGLGAVIFFARKDYCMRSQRLMNGAGLLLCLIGVFIACSTMAVLGTAAGMGYVLWRGSPRTAYRVAAGSAGLLLLFWFLDPYASFFSFTGRLSVWPTVVDAWLRSPLFGHGPGAWAGNYDSWSFPAVMQNRWDQAHNDFLQVLPEQGALGLAIVLGGLALLFIAAQGLPPVYGGLIALLCVTALGNFILHLPCFGLVAGWLASSVHNHEERGTPCSKLR